MKTLGMAEYGGDEFLIATISCGLAAFVLNWFHPLLPILPLIPYAIIVWFFRDPNRSGLQDAELMLSPADGTVTDITELEEPDYIRGRAMRIGIFLSPFNVHVNRVPCDGVVEFSRYRAGEFLPAYNPQAPERNESITLGLATRLGFRIIVKQVTGVLARRIICEARLGDELKRGERYGMIKFGSRTELYVPIEAYAGSSVTLGDKVRGGETVLCKVKALNIAPATTQEISSAGVQIKVQSNTADLSSLNEAGPAHAG
jgi:phosphatidylserine decarboxylase